MQLLKDQTNKYQSDLGKYALNGGEINIPGINQNNISQYHRLVSGVFYDSLEKAYPLTHNLLTNEEWDKIMDEFRCNYKCQSHQIWRMPEEFYHFFTKQGDHPLLLRYPFLNDLLLMEWLEIEVYMMEDENISGYKSNGDIEKDTLLLNPEIRIRSLNYPVHLKRANEIKPDDKGSFILCLHRHPNSGNVIFTNLSLIHARLIIELQDLEKSNFKFLMGNLIALGTENPTKLLKNFLEEALKSKLILGFSK